MYYFKDDDAIIAAGAVASIVNDATDMDIWVTDGDDDTDSVSSYIGSIRQVFNFFQQTFIIVLIYLFCRYVKNVKHAKLSVVFHCVRIVIRYSCILLFCDTYVYMKKIYKGEEKLLPTATETQKTKKWYIIPKL